MTRPTILLADDEAPLTPADVQYLRLILRYADAVAEEHKGDRQIRQLMSDVKDRVQAALRRVAR